MVVRGQEDPNREDNFFQAQKRKSAENEVQLKLARNRLD